MELSYRFSDIGDYFIYFQMCELEKEQNCFLFELSNYLFKSWDSKHPRVASGQNEATVTARAKVNLF